MTATFRRYGFDPDRCHVRLIEGWFEHTLRNDGPVALAHIDGDWYESVFCLSCADPALARARRRARDRRLRCVVGMPTAVDEYLADKKDRFEWVTRARLHLVRK